MRAMKRLSTKRCAHQPLNLLLSLTNTCKSAAQISEVSQLTNAEQKRTFIGAAQRASLTNFDGLPGHMVEDYRDGMVTREAPISGSA